MPEPAYWHHPLLRDEGGDKLAKSRASPALADMRAKGVDRAELITALRKGRLPLGFSLSRLDGRQFDKEFKMTALLVLSFSLPPAWWPIR